MIFKIRLIVDLIKGLAGMPPITVSAMSSEIIKIQEKKSVFIQHIVRQT